MDLDNLTTIITCKNRTRNLSYCLGSISTCIHRPQVIVVDFGSDKPVTEITRSYPWVRMIRVMNDTRIFHKSRAINIGIKNTRTKFLCITDVDQVFQANFFYAVKSVLEKDNSSFVMCPTFFLKQLPKNITPLNIRENYKKLLTLAKKSGVAPHGDGCCNGLLTSVALSIGGYDENYIGYGAEDSDFALRSIMFGNKKVWLHKLTTMVHLPHEKKGDYYKKDVFMKNKNLFFSKVKSRDIVANKNKPWGML